MGVTIMANKEKLKSAIEQDINPKNYYKEIIFKIENGEKRNMKNNMWKWSLIPISLTIVICSFLLFKYQNDNEIILKNKPYIDENNNVILNINEINENKVSQRLIDAALEVVTNNDVNFPLPYKNAKINLPEDLVKINKQILYFRENKENKEYNILGNYEIGYSDGNDRTIQVKYSKENKPARDYYFDENGSVATRINNTELKIFQFENIYFTEFEFNGYNFDIETSNITKQELINFLLSILE